jgi:hypothetical protein
MLVWVGASLIIGLSRYEPGQGSRWSLFRPLHLVSSLRSGAQLLLLLVVVRRLTFLYYGCLDVSVSSVARGYGRVVPIDLGRINHILLLLLIVSSLLPRRAWLEEEIVNDHLCLIHIAGTSGGANCPAGLS